MIQRCLNSFHFMIPNFSTFNLNLKSQISRVGYFKLSHSNSQYKYFEEMTPRPFDENDKNVWVSPPHPKSNLRLIVFPQAENVINEEREFIQKYEQTQDWNQKYWEEHNENFLRSKELYISKVIQEKNLPKDQRLTDEEMSIFYQNFLQENHKKHVQYNWDWYKRNLNLLFLAAKLQAVKMKKILTR